MKPLLLEFANDLIAADMHSAASGNRILRRLRQNRARCWSPTLQLCAISVELPLGGGAAPAGAIRPVPARASRAVARPPIKTSRLSLYVKETAILPVLD